LRGWRSRRPHGVRLHGCVGYMTVRFRDAACLSVGLARRGG
jgi:hypothetical protein